MTEDAIRRDERQRCAADICHWCEQGNPIDERYRHWSKGNYLRCFATNIWMRDRTGRHAMEAGAKGAK